MYISLKDMDTSKYLQISQGMLLQPLFKNKPKIIFMVNEKTMKDRKGEHPYLDKGHKKGNVIITLDDNNK